MARRSDRGGAKTRARIAAVATQLFLEQGFDQVTIADVAAAAGVSRVTVFAHFERKEDLLFDRLPDAIELVRDAVRNRAPGVDPIESIRQMSFRLAEQRHTLSGLSEGVEPFMQMVAASPALQSRLRAFETEIETELTELLAADSVFTGDARLAAALIVAAYRVVAITTIGRRLAADDLDEVTSGHEQRLNAAFDVIASGLSTMSN
jgi:AcrR family transcriptional regulator